MKGIEKYEKAVSVLGKEWGENLISVSKGFSKVFSADGYSLVSGTVVKLRGCNYYSAAEDVCDGDILRCELEPKNKHDNKAIRVHDWDGDTVGHLAADSDIREEVRAVLESGAWVYAIVVESTILDPYGKIKVIFVKDDE